MCTVSKVLSTRLIKPSDIVARIFWFGTYFISTHIFDNGVSVRIENQRYTLYEEKQHCLYGYLFEIGKFPHFIFFQVNCSSENPVGKFNFCMTTPPHQPFPIRIFLQVPFENRFRLL
jgi:hypothetical protein